MPHSECQIHVKYYDVRENGLSLSPAGNVEVVGGDDYKYHIYGVCVKAPFWEAGNTAQLKSVCCPSTRT